MSDPVQYYLYKDYARFGLTATEANIILAKRIPNRLGYTVKAIVHHIQDGRTVGSLKHWVGVQASSTVMVQRDGSVLWIIAESDGPWTNGDVCNSQATVQYLIDAGDGDPNLVVLTIEVEGTPWEPVTQAQLATVEWLDRLWMKKFPQITVKNIHRHREINTCSRWNCPGASDENDYHLAVMKRLNGGTTTKYADPIIYPWLKPEELEKSLDRKIGKTPVYAMRRIWETSQDTFRFRTASLNEALSNQVGPKMPKGTTFPGEFVFFNSKGLWVLTEYGTRVYGGHLVMPFDIKPR